jgi:hypothetical protein
MPLGRKFPVWPLDQSERGKNTEEKEEKRAEEEETL